MQHSSRVKSCCLSPKQNSFICPFLHFQQSNVSEDTIFPTAGSQDSCDHHLSIHHKHNFGFHFIPVLTLCIIYKGDLIFYFVFITILFLVILLHTMYMVHIRSYFLKNPLDMSGLFLIKVMSSWKWFWNLHGLYFSFSNNKLTFKIIRTTALSIQALFYQSMYFIQ